jgi:predicted RNase H-like HicB family nuclease
MNLTFSAIFEEVPESEGGGYVAYTEELPGAISEGDTLAEARENLRDAIEVLLEANREPASQSHRGKKVSREKITIPVLRFVSASSNSLKTLQVGVGVLRLRCCRASRSSSYAQEDRVWEFQPKDVCSGTIVAN